MAVGPSTPGRSLHHDTADDTDTAHRWRVERMTMSSTGPTTPEAYRSSSATGPPGSSPGAAGPARRTWSGALIGGVLIGTGVVVLRDVVAATAVSVLFLGWTLVIGGAVGIGSSMMLVGRGGFWIGMLSGVLAVVAG